MVEDANAQAALDVLARLLEVRDPDDLPGEIVAAVGDAIDHDGAVFAVMSTGGDGGDRGRPADITAGPVAASFEERAGSLALVPHPAAGGGSSSLRSEV